MKEKLIKIIKRYVPDSECAELRYMRTKATILLLTKEVSNERLTYSLKERHFADMEGSNFHSILYILIRKSDPGNKKRLIKGFPEEVIADLFWDITGDDFKKELIDLKII